MTTGLQVWNNGNILQIDGTYQNYHVTGTGSIYCDRRLGTQNDSVFFADLTFNGVNQPLLAFYGPADSFHYPVSRSGNAITYRVGIKQGSPGMFNWILFDLASAAPTPSPGFQVFNEDGTMIFDGNRKAMRVIDVITGDTSSFPSGNPLTRDYGKTVALIQTKRIGFTDNILINPGNPPQYLTVFYSSCGRTSGGSLVLSYRDIGANGPTTTPPGIIAGSRQFFYLVLNIDGFF